jgi:AcrR family transcriptional regulator
MPTQTSRGLATRQGILAAAAAIASVDGLEGLTLGRLATDLSMSKSGLFAHFGSKEDLQLATIEYARQIYVDQVILPGLTHARGIATLHLLCDRYLALMERRAFPGGCFFAAAMAEFDARPGVVRDTIAMLQRQWLDLLERAAQDGVQRGELQRDLDPVQLGFELEAAMLSANWYFHLYSDDTFFALSRAAVERTISAAATAKGRRVLGEVVVADAHHS